MNFFFMILLWQHILYLCTLFVVQGGKGRSMWKEWGEREMCVEFRWRNLTENNHLGELILFGKVTPKQ